MKGRQKVTKILLIIISVLLLGISGYASYRAWDYHKQVEQERDRFKNHLSEQIVHTDALREETFKLDELNTKVMGDLNDALQGNPNLSLYLATSAPDYVVGLVWDFYDKQWSGEDFPSDYIPRTRKEAIALGMTNKEILFTLFESAEAITMGNVKLKKTREFFAP